MSKKYMSRPPYCFGYIPDYSRPPMTVEEYHYYEKEFFGFLNDKPIDIVEEMEDASIQNLLQFIGISTISKYEDKVPLIKFNVQHVLRQNDEAGDSFRSRVRQENKATQTVCIAKSDQEVQTIKTSRSRRFLKSVRQFCRRSFKCLKTED